MLQQYGVSIYQRERADKRKRVNYTYRLYQSAAENRITLLLHLHLLSLFLLLYKLFKQKDMNTISLLPNLLLKYFIFFYISFDRKR